MEKDRDIIRLLHDLASRYSSTPDGIWLTEIGWIDIPVTMRELPKDVCGMYAAGRIWLMPCGEPSAIFPTYVHELRHRWQWKMHPFMYIIGKIYRPLIEDDAVCQEHVAENWIYSKEKNNGKSI